MPGAVPALVLTPAVPAACDPEERLAALEGQMAKLDSAIKAL